MNCTVKRSGNCSPVLSSLDTSWITDEIVNFPSHITYGESIYKEKKSYMKKKGVYEEERDAVNFAGISTVINHQGIHTDLHILANETTNFAVYKSVFNTVFNTRWSELEGGEA